MRQPYIHPLEDLGQIPCSPSICHEPRPSAQPKLSQDSNAKPVNYSFPLRIFLGVAKMQLWDNPIFIFRTNLNKYPPTPSLLQLNYAACSTQVVEGSVSNIISPTLDNMLLLGYSVAAHSNMEQVSKALSDRFDIIGHVSHYCWSLQAKVPIGVATDYCFDRTPQLCIVERAPHIQLLGPAHKDRPQKKQVS